MGIIKNILKKDTDKAAKSTQSEDKTTDEVSAVTKVMADKKVEEKATTKVSVKKTTKEVAEKKQSDNVAKRIDKDAYKILQKPLITEKATDLVMLNKYIFAIPRSATRSEVAKKIINVYGVKPIKVNVANVKGKKVRRGRRFGKQKDWKKAIVTLAPEDKIEIYEGV